MMKNRLKNLGDRASEIDAEILKDDFADFGKDAQIPDDARERILSSVMGKAGFKMNNTKGVIKGHKSITGNKTDSNITASNGKLRLYRGGAIAACIAVIAAGAVTSTMLFGKKINTDGSASSKVEKTSANQKTTAEKNDNNVTMPDLIGKNIDSIDQDNLGEVVISFENNPDYDDGIIFWQSPEPGDPINSYDNVILRVCDRNKHDGSVTLPDFVGKEIDQVKMDFSDKLNFDIIEEYNIEYEEGIVFWQSQSAGRSVNEGYTITLKVSKGKQKTLVPDVSDCESEVAESELRAAQFTVVLRSKYDDNVPEGIAIGTEPAAGTEFPIGDMVTLYVSKGPLDNKVKVPNVVGLTKEKAITILKENKLKANVEDMPYEGDKGKVIDMSLEPDRRVERDTEVTIYVSTGVTDPVDLTISMPMPKGLTGKYTVNGIVNGITRYIIPIPDASAVAGGAITMDISGKKTERLKVTLKNEATGESIDYGEFVVNYDKKTAELVGELNKDLQFDKNDLVDLTISIPMPEDLSGKYTVKGMVDGKARYTQKISDAKTVAGGAITMDISGKDTETLTISLTNESTGKSVNYAVFNINYDKKTAELNGAFNKDGLLNTMK
ncbi:PASTA domain-containing protein [Ruminococcus albus]|uniref:PASTA domain, binds beta-lactams n=1 Tax=Ruminococcus albus TaxID=1264 RepID=A0A1I1DSK0_RUMAL|nr:PASTA domain-containing protein [Ruminococcus albus]SFB76018.1 PASTA domain, binds beta-lactams [Ruminococcus albus]